jgi:hypothetical protein
MIDRPGHEVATRSRVTSGSVSNLRRAMPYESEENGSTLDPSPVGSDELRPTSFAKLFRGLPFGGPEEQAYESLSGSRRDGEARRPACGISTGISTSASARTSEGHPRRSLREPLPGHRHQPTPLPGHRLLSSLGLVGAEDSDRRRLNRGGPRSSGPETRRAIAAGRGAIGRVSSGRFETICPKAGTLRSRITARDPWSLSRSAAKRTLGAVDGPMERGLRIHRGGGRCPLVNPRALSIEVDDGRFSGPDDGPAVRKVWVARDLEPRSPRAHSAPGPWEEYQQ